MLLYNITVPNKDVCSESELYFRGGELRGDGVFVKSGERATFDTYFNCFSHTKYKQYTRVTDVTLKLNLQGKGVVSLCLYDGKDTEILAKKEFYGVGGECDVSFNISDLKDKGFVYFAIDAYEDCTLLSGGWHSDVQADFVRIGVVICTYKREEYVRRNLGNLTAYMRTLDDRFFDVFVVDNGRTLTEDFGEGVKLIPNENTGGSGGFTRGMREVCEAHKGEYTHFLLMDDDIVFDTSTLWRTYAMLSILKDEYKNASIGAAMLILDRPYLQQVLGDDWDGINVQSHRKRIDARVQNEIVLNEEDCEPDYNGWFYMCMPVSSVEKHGYPLPFFIKFDDVEYGLRATEHIITSSGIAVWHEDFDAKYSPELEYYSIRNGLITNVRYPRRKGALACWKKIAFAVGKRLIWQRYFEIDLIFKACEDFFRGPDWLMTVDSAGKHIELRGLSPKFLNAEEIEKKYNVLIDCGSICEQGESMPKITDVFNLLGYLVPKCLYKKGITQVNMTNYSPRKYALKRNILQFNPVTGKGFVTEIKKLPLIKAGFKLVGYFFKMAFCYRAVARKYRAVENR